MTKSWKPELQVSGEDGWHTNALRFATKEEAEASAQDTYGRWLLATAWRASESDDPVNYKLDLTTWQMTPVAKEAA